MKKKGTFYFLAVQSMVDRGERCQKVECPLFLFLFRLLIVAALMGPGAPGPVAHGASEVHETLEAFLKHLEQSDSFAAEAKQFVSKEWKRRRDQDDAESFLAEALAVLSPRFRTGLDSYDDDDYAAAFRTMDALSSDQDPYLSANANVFAVKSLVEQDRLEEALERLEAFLADPTAVDLYTFYAAEMAYVRGYTQLQALRYDAASASLGQMLERYPDAPRRLVVTARQMLAELARREPRRLGDVADLMGFAGRRLGLSDTGQGVQGRQARAVELLDKLIEEAEANEQQGGGASSSSGGSPGGQQSPQSPMQESQLPSGGGSGMQLREKREARPGEAWGTMPPAEREKILQTLRDSFPSRYRQLVEQYFQELAKQP